MKPDALPLVPVCKKHFAHKVINSEEECTVQEFCTQNGLDPKAFYLFVAMDLRKGTKKQLPRDAILMNRVSNSCNLLP